VLVHGDRPIDQPDPVVPRPDAALLPAIRGSDVIAATSPDLTRALDAGFDAASSDGSATPTAS
jgi:hypothetical protein